MTSFTFLVPDADAARFDRIAEGQGGRSALLRRLVSAVLDDDRATPMPMVPARSTRADQRLELLLTADEVAAIEARAAARGMKRSAWLVSLVRRHLHRHPEPPAPDAKVLEGIRGELRRIGVSLHQIVSGADEEGGPQANRGLSTLMTEIRELIAAVGAARHGDLSYWEAPE